MTPAIGHERKRLFEFGDFRLDPGERVLARNGERIALTPKAFETLVLLIQNSGHVLSKDELIKTLWPESFVEENNLTQQISQVRRALGESADGQSYIETVPKVGYRFTAQVREVVESEGEATLPSVSSTDGAQRNVQNETSELAAGRQPITAISRNWTRVLLFAAALVFIIAGVYFDRVLRSSRAAAHAATVSPVLPTPPVKPRYSVVVLGLKNLSGRAADDWLSPALAEMLTTELSAGGQLRVVSSDDVHAVASDLGLSPDANPVKSNLTQIRRRLGADVIVTGAYAEIGPEPNGQIRLDLQMQDASAGDTVFSTAVSGKSQELFALVARGGAQLRSKLGVPMLSDSEGAQDQAEMPSTPEAARLYSQGLTRLRQFDAPAAEALLAKTVNVDPNFALGHAALASAWSALGYDEKAKAEARRALDLSQNLSREEHLKIAGQYNELTRDWPEAVKSYQDLYSLFPDNVDYGLAFASAQTSAGKGSDALATLGKLRNLPAPLSDDPRIDLGEAEAQDSLGNFKQVLESAERAINNGTGLGERLLVARAWIRKSWALRRLGQTGDAIAGLQEAKRIFAETGDMQGVGSSQRLIGGSQQEHGDYVQAQHSFQEAIAIFRKIGDRRSLAMSINGLAIGYYERGDYREAKTLDEQYLEIEEEVGSKINTAGALGNIANVEDAQGNLAEARRLNEDSVKIFTEVGDQRALGTALGNLANLLYEQGDLADARKKYDEALEIKRKISYQRGIAYDLSGLSGVQQAEGDLNAAQQTQQQALSLREQIGEKHNAASSRLSLAILALEDHRPADAEKLASETLQQFHQEKSPADEAIANEVFARSLLAENKLDEAQAAIGRANAAAQGATNIPLSFDLALTSARIKVAAKKSPNAAAIASAERNLETSLALARRCGYLEYEYKLELALGEIEIHSGESQQGRARLDALSKKAGEKGFKLIARDSAAPLNPPSSKQ